MTLLCACDFHQHKCLVYEWVIDVTSFNKHTIDLVTYPSTRYAPHYLCGKPNEWTGTLYESLLLALFMYKSIIPVHNDAIHWDKYLYNPLFFTWCFVHLCGGRRFWVWVGRLEYGNLFYPP